ncbi:hypothetical protein TrCOL_g231 [Triparma columacea]|uniref:Uncharacterized protein n=1 Tax=Triparma columacea TaxID=722753 RepID=A0A9W7G3T8_9STRA|nr:hypothetical protein TrCOL_g231 [Triparma columacea]
MKVNCYEMTLVLGGSASSSTGCPLKLKEYEPAHRTKECDAVVEADLDTQASYPLETKECDPFGEEFVQSWNVTPIEVFISNQSGEDCWCYVFVDGEKDKGMHNLSAGESKTIRGFTNDDGSVREILFSRPRLLKKDEDIQEPTEFEKFEVGSIRVDFHRVTSKTNYTDHGRGGGGIVTHSESFEGANKKLASKAKVGATARPGKTLLAKKSQAPSKHQGPRQMTTWHFDTQKATETIRIRYAMKEALLKDGVVTAPLLPQGDSKKGVKAQGQVLCGDDGDEGEDEEDGGEIIDLC